MQRLATKTGFSWSRLCQVASSYGLALGLLIGLPSLAAKAQAEELVVFKNGMDLVVQSHLIEGDRMTLQINDRSQMEIAANWVEKIDPYTPPPAPPQVDSDFPPNSTTAALDLKQLKSLIAKTAKKYQLDEHLLKAIIQAESNFNPRAISSKGALGLMQLMPETAALMKVSNVWDAAENIEGGAKYLKELLATFNQDLVMALAAYNAGPNVVSLYNGIPTYPETRQYVRTVLTLMRSQ